MSTGVSLGMPFCRMERKNGNSGTKFECRLPKVKLGYKTGSSVCNRAPQPQNYKIFANYAIFPTICTFALTLSYYI